MNVFKSFRKSERGSFSVEAILMFPMLVWGFMAMYVFFEGLRESNINLKATYTLADLLSREEQQMDMTDITGITKIYQWLARTPVTPEVRVTVVHYDATTDRHLKHWSKSTTKDELTQDQIDQFYSDTIPVMANGSAIIIVESWAEYIPIMRIGLMETDIYNRVVSTPRFTPTLNFEGIGDGGGDTHDDDTTDENGDDVT